MSERLDEVLIDHLISLEGCCERTMRIGDGKSLEDLLASEVLQLAASMAVAQIGEVSGRILKTWPTFAERHPEVELAPALAMRHRLIHVYEQTDLATLWDTVQTSVPAMLLTIQKIIRESGSVGP